MNDDINIRIDDPVLSAYYYDNARRVFIMGPKGSGKTVASCSKLFKDMVNQKPAKNGGRYTRMFAVRDTTPNLQRTTIKTWQSWFDRPEFGYFYKSPPWWHKIHFPLPDGTFVDSELHFIALDSAKDLDKLNSMEATKIYINECKDILFSLIKGCEGTLRYPAADKGTPTNPGIIGDSNPPDSDHWMHELMVTDPNPAKWHMYRQPGAAIRGADGSWEMNIDPSEEGCAENIKNLPNGYYENMMVSAPDDYVKVYVANEFGFFVDGVPIISEYNENEHLAKFRLEFDINLKIYGGVDYGRTPVLVLGQKDINGKWYIIEEHPFFGISIEEFGKQIAPIIKKLIYRGFQFGQITDDPAGSAPAQNDNKTSHTIVEQAFNDTDIDINFLPAAVNNFVLRREALGNACISGLLVDPKCQVANKGMKGGYCWRKIQGKEETEKEPRKNKYSHTVEAIEYMILGGGQMDAVVNQMQMGKGVKARGFDIEAGVM